MDSTMLQMIYNDLRHRGIVSNQTDFGDRLGWGRAAASQYLNGRVPPKDIEQKLATAFPQVNFVDLQLMLAQTENPARPTGADIARRKAFEGRQKTGIPTVPISAQANYRSHFTDPVFIDQLGRFSVPDFPYDGDKFRAFQIEGDSMTIMKDGREEGLLDRDWIIAEKIDPEYWRSIKSFYIYVIVTKTLITVKRLHPLNQFEFAMIPDNEEYDQEPLDIEDIQELWLVKRKLEWDMAPPRRIEVHVKPKRGDASSKRGGNNARS